MKLTLHITLLTGLLIFGVVGCSKTATDENASADGGSHDDEHLPVSYSAAVDKIAEYRDSIESAFESGSPDDCHQALHEIGHLISHLPEMASKTALEEADKLHIKEASDELKEAFSKVDSHMHGLDGGAEFKDVAAEIEASMATLKSKIELAGEDVIGEVMPDHDK